MKTYNPQQNSYFVLIIFISTLLFQITAYKFIWGIESASRFVNIALLISCGYYIFHHLINSKINSNVFYYYIIPGILVTFSYFYNITTSSISNFNIVNQYGLLLPWLIYLTIPFLMKSNKINIDILWKYFYKIILLIMIASIIEYFLILNGFVSLRTINTSGGYFLSGIFSMMHGLENGDVHYRFYASFMEPGTLAMYLIPMIIYTFLKKRYYSLVIFAFAMYLTDSLGGFISVALAIPLLIYYRSNKKNAFISLILLLLTTALLIFSFKNEFLERYEQKGNSASIREENFTQMINNLPELLSNYPFGIPLSENTEQAMTNSLHFGFNFTPNNAYNLGGIFAFIGYITVLLLSLWYATTSLLKRTVSSNIEQIAIISIICLIPFIFQRATVWDSNIFSLLIAPFIISFLSSKKVRR